MSDEPKFSYDEAVRNASIDAARAYVRDAISHAAPNVRDDSIKLSLISFNSSDEHERSRLARLLGDHLFVSLGDASRETYEHVQEHLPEYFLYGNTAYRIVAEPEQDTLERFLLN